MFIASPGLGFFEAQRHVPPLPKAKGHAESWELSRTPLRDHGVDGFA